jgi:holo-[acyl-carrier protein] synthase
MRVFGIGIDVVEIGRIAAAIDRHGERFLAKIFTAAERAYCETRKHPAPHYAARFAAKEAVSKALGCGIGKNAGLHDLEILHDSSGAPKLHLHGAAEKFAKDKGINDIQISLTHTREYAAANAVALCETQYRNPI